MDKTVLVDRICRLQRAHAKKNEKLEFLEEHNRSLVEDIKKKNRHVLFLYPQFNFCCCIDNLCNENYKVIVCVVEYGKHSFNISLKTISTMIFSIDLISLVEFYLIINADFFVIFALKVILFSI